LVAHWPTRERAGPIPQSGIFHADGILDDAVQRDVVADDQLAWHVDPPSGIGLTLSAAPPVENRLAGLQGRYRAALRCAILRCRRKAPMVAIDVLEQKLDGMHDCLL